MITTQGFGVNVLPSYQPIDPSLAAFNPAQVTHGLMDAYQTSGTLDQLKAFRQHAAEIAATEHVRTQLLQAQADQAAIQRDNASAEQQSKIDAMVAANKALAKVAPAQANAGVAGANLGTAKDIAALTNVAPAAKLEAATIQTGLGAQNLTQTQQQTAQQVAEHEAGGAGLELAKAKENTQLAQLKSQAAQFDSDLALADKKRQAADIELTDTIKNYSSGQASHRQLIEAQANAQNAHAEYFKGRAAYDQFQRGQGKPYQDLQVIDNAISQEGKQIADLLSKPVSVDEKTGKPITLDQYLTSREEQKNSQGQVMKGGVFGFGAHPVGIPQNIQDRINELNAHRNRVNQFRQQQDDITKRMSAGQETQGINGQVAPQELSPEDQEALQWAQDNQSDPRAAEIISKIKSR